MDILKYHEVTKQEYFEAAAEYYRIQADLVALRESEDTSEKNKAKIKKMESQLRVHADIMSEYCGELGSDKDMFLKYPRLSKAEAKREILSKEKLSHLRSGILSDVVILAITAIASPFLIRFSGAYDYGFWKLFFSSFLYIPGIAVVCYILGTLITYPLKRKASEMEYEDLPAKEKFIKHARIYQWLAIAVSIIAGILIGVSICVL